MTQALAKLPHVECATRGALDTEAGQHHVRPDRWLAARELADTQHGPCRGMPRGLREGTSAKSARERRKKNTASASEWSSKTPLLHTLWYALNLVVVIAYNCNCLRVLLLIGARGGGTVHKCCAQCLSWLLNLRDLHFIGFVAIFADDGGISTLADVLHCEN